jgi:hypothetical protein
MLQSLQKLVRNNPKKVISISLGLILLVVLVTALILTLAPNQTTMQAANHSAPQTLATSTGSSTATKSPGATITSTIPTPTTVSGSSAATATPLLPTATPTRSYHYQMMQVINSGVTPSGYSPKTVEITATCPQGTYMMSGGYKLTDPPGATRDHTNLAVTPDSYPLNTSSWHLSSGYANPQSATFYVYANCLRTDFPVKTTIVSSSSGASGVYIAQCPAGMLVTGGGWRYSRYMMFSQAIGTSWNAQGSQIVYAICAAIGLQTETTPSHIASVVTSTKQLSASIAVSCLSGQLLVGGGFISEGSYDVFVFNAAWAASDFSDWNITVMNIDSVNTYNATATAVCVSLA